MESPQVYRLPQGGRVLRFPDRTMRLTMRWGITSEDDWAVTPEMDESAAIAFSHLMQDDEVALYQEWHLMNSETISLCAHSGEIVRTSTTGLFTVTARALRVAEWEYVQEGQPLAISGGAL